MKISKYNKFFDSNDGTKLAYNCRKNGLAILTKQKYRQVQNILSAPDVYRFDTPTKKELLDNLLRGGFLIEDGMDELAMMKVRYNSARFNARHFSLTVMPTLNCNFRCVYCYEARKNITMTEDIQKSLLEFVKTKTENADLFVTHWYGGEPLLTLDTVIYLCNAFKRICTSNGCHYEPGGIVTNGYLLTRSVAKKLDETGIRTAQITLDGPKGIHNERRPLANGNGTFDRILDNLCNVVGILANISIRINTDKTNASRVIEILDALEERGLKGKVRVYFAKVRANTDACVNFAGSCLMDQEYSVLETQLAKQALDKGFNLNKYPRTKINYCMADHVNAFVVDPTGYLYKCWSTAGDVDKAVGHICDTEIQKKKYVNMFQWLAWDAFEREECRKCDILPLCMGGCPYEVLRHTTNQEELHGACETWRHNLLDILRIYYTAHCQSHNSANTQDNKNMTVKWSPVLVH
jgi:uncharacterized protein